MSKDGLYLNPDYEHQEALRGGIRHWYDEGPEYTWAEGGVYWQLNLQNLYLCYVVSIQYVSFDNTYMVVINTSIRPNKQQIPTFTSYADAKAWAQAWIQQRNTEFAHMVRGASSATWIGETP